LTNHILECPKAGHQLHIFYFSIVFYDNLSFYPAFQLMFLNHQASLLKLLIKMNSERKKPSTYFKPLKVLRQNVGRRIKSTKIRYTWHFELEKRTFFIDLYVSRLSGKRKILVNGDVFAEEKLKSSGLSVYILKIGSHIIELLETDDNIFDLRADKISFLTEVERINKNGINFDEPQIENFNNHVLHNSKKIKQQNVEESHSHIIEENKSGINKFKKTKVSEDLLSLNSK
jgi:hypothetical protein